nr:70 kDa peptidyl-prolyl isomerase-like isoform X1 [Ziziphus jujuba var. spinosa]
MVERKILTERNKRRETNNGLSCWFGWGWQAEDRETDSRLSNWGMEIGKQGLRKLILRKGTNYYHYSCQSPSQGDEVQLQVHFSGWVKGGATLEYESSTHHQNIRNITNWTTSSTTTPLCFKLGQCEVIKGLDEGVATMQKGERAVFSIPPNLAYGELGSPPFIPPSSTLFFDIELLSWTTIRDLTGDGGLFKKITRDGHGWATPRDADQVLVNYEARLENGTLVTKSEGAEFHIGDACICPAISIAVKTMRRGEVAELAVKFLYGFKEDVNGTTNTESCISSASNIAIQLELISWKSVIDITGDRKVVKKIIKAGEGFDCPNEGSLVKVIYIGKLDDGSVMERKGSEEEPFVFVSLQEQINEGLERAIITMKKGEQALVTVDAEYLGSYGASGLVSASSALHYEVQLIDFTKEKPYWKMDTHEKMEACERKKHNGNLLFKAGKYWRASKKYEKAANYVDFDHSFTKDEKRAADSLRLSCNLNNAACKLKLGEYHEASRLCTKVLEIDPFNVKALYRRSQAYKQVSEFEKAEADIKTALTIDPNNRDVKLEHKELKDKQREYTRYQSEIFSTMFARIYG